MLKFLYNIAKNYPTLCNPILRAVIPLLIKKLRSLNITIGDIVVDFASLINYPVVTREKLRGDYLIWVFRNDLVGSEIHRYGCFEKETIDVLEVLLRPGMCFFDIGANVGQYTLIGSGLVGPSGRVHSFEPHPLVFSLLEKNILENNISNVLANKLGLSNFHGKAKLFVSSVDLMGLGSIRSNIYSSGETIDINVVTLENYINNENVETIDVIKMDVEGAEMTILSHAKSLINRMNSIVILEFNQSRLQEFDCSTEQLATFLRECGYAIYRIWPGRLEPFSEDQSEASFYNVLAWPSGRALPENLMPAG